MVVAKVRSVQAPRREARLDETPPYVWPDPAPEWIHAKMGGAAPRRLKVAETNRDGKTVVLELAAGVPREVIAALKGVDLVVPKEEAERCRAGKWYAPEWRGYSVLGGDAEVLGVVREVWTGPANAVMIVETGSGDRWALPVIDEVVLAVDRETHEVTIKGFEPFGIPHEG